MMARPIRSLTLPLVLPKIVEETWELIFSNLHQRSIPDRFEDVLEGLHGSDLVDSTGALKFKRIPVRSGIMSSW